MIKNTAGQRIGAQMISASDGSAFTGSVTVAVTVDAGTQATGSVGSGACAHEGNGYHTYAPAQAETNGDLIAFTFTGPGAIPVTVQVYTVAGDAFTRLGAPAGASVSADVAAVKVDTAAILVDTGTTLDARIPAALVSGRMDASVGAMAANVMTAAAAASDLTTELQSGLATAAALSTLDGKVDTIDGIVDAILVDTGTTLDGRLPAALVSGRIDASVGAMQTGVVTADALAANAITAAKIAADAITAAKLASDVTDEIWAKALTEPGGVPAVNATAIAALSWLLALSRNRITQTAGVQTLRNDANSADIAAATVSDDGTTFVRSEFA